MVTSHKLNTGASIPAVGFGTWQDKADQEEAVAVALNAGFRHIDTARSKFPSITALIWCIRYQSFNISQRLSIGFLDSCELP